MKRVIYLAAAVLVAMLILVPTAMAQATKLEVTKTTEATVEGKLPKSGGPEVTSILLPAGALLLGSGVLAYAVLRRRQ